MDTGLTFEEQQLQGRTFLKKLGIPVKELSQKKLAAEIEIFLKKKHARGETKNGQYRVKMTAFEGDCLFLFDDRFFKIFRLDDRLFYNFFRSCGFCRHARHYNMRNNPATLKFNKRILTYRAERNEV